MGLSVPGMAGLNRFNFSAELLLLQFEQGKLQQQTEREKLALEKLKQATEMKKLKLEEYKLTLIQDDKMAVGSGSNDSSLSPESPQCFDVAGNLCLVPKFCERDPDTFFSLFEHVADSRGWPDSQGALLLQSFLTAKAEEVCASFSVSNSKSYSAIKVAMFEVYELMPVAHRQKFSICEVM